jgi:hypothetical protein
MVLLGDFPSFLKNLRSNIFSFTKMHATSHANACEKFIWYISSVLWIFDTAKLCKVLKSSVSWDVRPYSPMKVNWACCMIHAALLLDLFLNCEQRRDIFLWNISWLSSAYTESYLRWKNSLPPLWEPEILQAPQVLFIFPVLLKISPTPGSTNRHLCTMLIVTYCHVLVTRHGVWTDSCI